MRNKNSPDNKAARQSELNERRTQVRIEQYYGLVGLLATWEDQPDSVQADNHDYIIRLRAKVRTVKAYLMHRADAKVNL